MSEENINDIDDEFPLNVMIQIKRQLTVHGKVYLSLPKVEEGSVKKMRFTIVTLCPKCGAANHVLHVDGQAGSKEDCDVCHNSQVFAAKTEIFSIYSPIGTYHGSTVLLQDEGSFGPEGIRGDIVVTFLDEPHEHFLRVYDDIIVCFQIDREECADGVIRLLTLAVPNTQDVVLKTKDGETICDNDVHFVNGLGLPMGGNKDKRGKLIVVFIVKEQRSMFPIKLKNIILAPDKESKQMNGKLVPQGSLDEIKEDPAARKTNGIKRSRPAHRQMTRKRRKSALLESKASTSSDSLSGEHDSLTKSSKDRVPSPINPIPSDIDTEEAQMRWSRILDNPIGRLTASDIDKHDPLDPKRLSFLDRLVYSRSIPLPYKTPVADPIDMVNLKILWERIHDPFWWERAEWSQSLPKDIDSLKSDIFLTRSSLKRTARICFNQPPPIFDVKSEKLDDAAEALKTICTMQSSSNPEFLQINLQKFSRDEKFKLLQRIKSYLQETDQ